MLFLSVLVVACSPESTPILPSTHAPAPTPTSAPKPTSRPIISTPRLIQDNETDIPVTDAHSNENRSDTNKNNSIDELYQGIMIDTHAHFKSKVVNIDELIIFLDQASINKVVLFAGATALQDA